MPAPKQVQQQVEAVNELYDDLGVVKADPKAAPNDNTVVVAQTPADDGRVPAAPLVINEPVAGNEDDDWEQKYRTLQGMFNAQVPKLTAENREMSSQLQNAETRLQNLEGLIASMQQGQPRQAPSAAPAPQSRLTDAEREEYGDSIEIMRKVTQDVVAPYEMEIRRLNGEVQRLTGTVVPQVARDSQQASQRAAQTAEQQFWSGLTGLVPNWREINDHPDFQTWLLEVDPLSGFNRQRFLDEAQHAQDFNRVAGFFAAWAKKNGAGPQAQPSGAAQQTELERQVAPGRGRTSAAPTGDARKTYTKDELTKFYADVRTGAYKGREDERNRIESDIFAAQRDGRIVQ